MKKKTGILLALVAALGWHSAATSGELKLYGLMDMGLNLENDGSGGGTVTRLSSGGQSSSRIGIKGSEALGGGLVASFVLENGILADTGGIDQGGVLFGRQSWVALGSDFGMLKLGRKYTVSAEVLDSFDPFHINMAGDASRLFNVSGKRVNNNLSYTTPELGGMSAQLSWGFGEQPGSLAAGRQLGASASYARGPLALALAYVDQDSASTRASASTIMLGGVYDAGALKLHAGAARNTDSAGLDTRDLLLGVSVPFGASLLLADYIRKWDSGKAGGNAGQFALGYSYALSRRTNLYTSYSQTHNGRAAKYNAARNGDTDRLFNAGIRHFF
ncbi:porin [Janthinobacterium sp. BJB446]|uniref:porin n=1 Tax=Janthinobacterium sp. BJB446 TaxID=2048009 RepID=UPI000C11DDB5|nr:porin [Janthinobacterium sp. BJB446]PHV23878.1 porin [Janthinobacterium sp. BJB446]